ncbi:MAG TPA: methylated-DNA--[protein]-cysteine S-methyltransferase [Acidobacteriota bacterium]|nr:methylated-DNA--[protein]-cysteine S-methyltransferase [Acidobacteriota bacterium]
MPGSGVSIAYFVSPIGTIGIQGTEAGVSDLNFVKAGGSRPAGTPPGELPAPLAEALVQLEEYFLGKRKVFTVELDLRGTEFQKRVWAKLVRVGFGRTTTYKGLAEAIGRPAATRAVGGANHSNPVSIIVPCHRVVGSDGSLTGYGGGLWRKEWLLRHEQAGLSLG